MMKAIFKPEDARKLIVRDADINEASLITNFLGSIKKGASLEAQPAYNGNQEVNGIVFTVGAEPDTPVESTLYIPVEASITNDLLNLPLLKIKITATDPSYTSFKVDEKLFESFKDVLTKLKLENVSITSDGTIVAENNTEAPITAMVVIPRGLLQYVNSNDSSTLNFNDNATISLGE